MFRPSQWYTTEEDANSELCTWSLSSETSLQDTQNSNVLAGRRTLARQQLLLSQVCERLCFYLFRAANCEGTVPQSIYF
jgi:hypothetical protein